MKAQVPAQSRDASNIKKNINSDETYETRSKNRRAGSTAPICCQQHPLHLWQLIPALRAGIKRGHGSIREPHATHRSRL